MNKKNLIKATTRNADWRGEAQADNNDFKSLRQYLQNKGWIEESDYVVAWKFFAGEHNSIKGASDLKVTAYFAPAEEVGRARRDCSLPIVDLISFDISVLDFFNLFKRISVALSVDGDFEEVSVRNSISK